jgi:cell division septum initiation protein DivIVA
MEGALETIRKKYQSIKEKNAKLLQENEALKAEVKALKPRNRRPKDPPHPPAAEQPGPPPRDE